MATNPVEFKTNDFFSNALGKEAQVVSANLYNQIEVITDIDAFFSLREQWNAINDESQNGNIFVSWEWLYTWWETYKNQSNRNLYILKCISSDNELLGIAPFQLVFNPKKYFPCSRQLILIGTGETDGSHVFGEYMDLVIKKGHETSVLNSFSSHLQQHKDLWDGATFNQQLAGSHLLSLFQNVTQSTPEIHQRCLLADKRIELNVKESGFRTYIELPETYKAYLMGLQKKMRNNITRTFTRLEKEQAYTIERVTTDSEINAQIDGSPSAIEILSNLNLTRRGDLEKHSVFSSPNFVLFHSRVLKRLMPLDKAVLRVLKFKGEPVAALYSFKDKDTLHAYQSGFETEMGHRYSLLTTMLTQEISHSIDDNELKRFNFMYSDEEATYKRRYSGTTETMYDISYNHIGLKYLVYRLIHGRLKEAVKKLMNVK